MSRYRKNLPELCSVLRDTEAVIDKAHFSDFIKMRSFLPLRIEVPETNPDQLNLTRHGVQRRPLSVGRISIPEGYV